MRKIYSMGGALVVILMLFSVPLLAQSQRVGGVVTDETGQGVPGVSILEKGTTNGTSSDNEGKYSLNVSGPNSILVFSFIGYTTQEITVGSRTTIDLPLALDVKSLEEVVVTGYASERKADIISAVSTLSPKNTVAIPVSSVEQAIQGRVAGVQVTTSGQPGVQANVRIRGFGSLGANSPLYIVDGVPTYDVSNINPNDIESTTILKDAGAASIYGSRAASGVIVYTTKHGKNDGKTSVTYEGSVGFTSPGKGIDILNPQQTADKTREAFVNAGQTPTHPQYLLPNGTWGLPDYINVNKVGGVMEGDPRIATALAGYNVDLSKGGIVQVVKANKEGTDWYKAMTRNAVVTRHSLGFSNGNEKSSYYLGLGYYNQQGIALNQYLSRYTMRLNSEFKPYKNLRIGENIQMSYTSNPQIGNQQSENQLNMAYRMNPIIPVYDVNGNYAGTAAPGLNNPANPVASLTRLNKDYNVANYFALLGNAYVEWDVIKALTLRSSIGGNFNANSGRTYSPQTYENSENTSSSTVNEAFSSGGNWIFTNTARYENKFGDHGLKVLAGVEAVKSNLGRNASVFGLNPFSSDPNYISVSNSLASGRQANSAANGTPSTLSSIFGRVDYSYKDKYYVSVTTRRDGASVFGAENRYGVFPAFTGGWRISGENFMAGASSWLDDLKLRGGWGIMGNQTGINPANQYTTYYSTPTIGYDITGGNSSVSSGVAPSQFGNAAGKWESNITSNVGFDATLMGGTLDIIVDVWQKKTKDMLFNPPLPAVIGALQNLPYINVGTMVNKGIDLNITKRQKINNDFDLVIEGNIGFIKNEVTKIADGTDYFQTGTFRNLTFVRNQVGHSLSEFYGYKVAGLFQSAQDVASSPTQDGAGPGRFKYADINNDGKITADDRTFIGSPIPKFTYGLNLTANYKSFWLTAFFYGKSGNKIVNFTRWFTDFYPSFSGAAIGARTLDSWTPENTSTTVPIYENVSNFSNNTQANSYYIENGSYLRMKNLQIGYKLPITMINKAGFKSLSVYVQAVNLFTITKYKGQDPEVASSVDTTLGIDVGNYPATRQYLFGVSLGL